jgi:hypothetical protein
MASRVSTHGAGDRKQGDEVAVVDGVLRATTASRSPTVCAPVSS